MAAERVGAVMAPATAGCGGRPTERKTSLRPLSVTKMGASDFAGLHVSTARAVTTLGRVKSRARFARAIPPVSSAVQAGTAHAIDQDMTTTQQTLWNLANTIGIGAEYNTSTRNPDAAIRAQFKADRSVRGTRAWAVCVAMSLRGTMPSDEDCALAIETLSA